MEPINRRAFIGGLAALAAAAALPSPAEASYMMVDIGSSQDVWSITIDGRPANIVSVSMDGGVWTECEAGDLIAGHYYKLELKHEEETFYATDLQLVSDQRASGPVEGKSKRLLKWIGGDRSYRNSGSMSGRFSPASSHTEERRRSSG